MAEQVAEPVPGPRAFASTGAAAEQSQAAILLAIGMQLRGDDVSLRARTAATPDGAGMSVFGEDDLERFPLPPVRPSAARFVPETLGLRPSGKRPALVRERAADYGGGAERGLRATLAERVYRDGSARSAADLFEASLRSPVPLVRVAAASSYLAVSTDPDPLIRTLAAGVRDPDPLVRDVAATALAHEDPTHRVLRPLVAGAPDEPADPSLGTALIVHGTWARRYSWWKPQGDFHSYLKRLRPDLYSAPDRFGWSGRYSAAARLKASSRLGRWVANHRVDGLDLFTHSHGGSVAMLATHGGMHVGKMVLLSCPVHPHRYYPEFGHTNRVVSIHVRMDLVILADRGGQRFVDPRIEENVLPVWFNHSATHDPRVWDECGVPRMI